MLNQVAIQGRLVSDPELRRTQSGRSVATFRIACDRDYKSKDSNAQNTDFFNVVAWEHNADFVSRYFTKGDMILISGRLQMRSYTDGQNQKKIVVEILSEKLNFGGSRRDSGTTANAGGYGYQQNSYAGSTGAGYGSNGYTNYPSAQPTYAPSNYSPPPMNQAPSNEFAELNDDDGELPF